MPRGFKPAVFVILGVLVMGGALLVATELMVEAPAPADADSPTVKATKTDFGKSTSGPQVGENVPLARRNVTPDTMTPPPPVTGPLVRVEGVKPEPPKVPPVPKRLTLQRVTVMDAGTLRHESMSILIAGIRPLTLSATCPSASGEDWPCGRVARTALRRLIRGRAVDCERTNGDEMKGSLVIAKCSVAKRDLGEWLITQGWAVPGEAAGEEANRLLADARDAGRGQWNKREQISQVAPALPDVLAPAFGRADIPVPEITGPAFELPANGPVFDAPTDAVLDPNVPR